MEFGKIDDPFRLDQINWKLPVDDVLSDRFLKARTADPSQTLKMGAPAWGHKEWVGVIYPPKTKTADYLYHYSRYFSCIELNTSHYRIPTPEQTRKWRELTPDDFRFCAKIFQNISHSRLGLIDKPLLQEWFKFQEILGTQAGPSFLQLPPQFEYNDKALLFQFLQFWPTEFKLALEFRHPSWFEEGKILPLLTQYLQSRKVGLVITDVAGRRDVLHSSISSDFTFIRFIGNNQHDSDRIRARLWNEKLQNWYDKGLQEIYFIVHQPDDIHAPQTTDYLRTLSTFQKFGHPTQKQPTLENYELN